MNNKIRVISGSLRGRNIILNDEDIRPTPQRIRETLFNWLMHDIADAKCLDLFAGSGALGIEAASRGAANVVFVESKHSISANLEATVADFKLDNVQVFNSDAFVYLKEKATLDFDVVFVDPPYSLETLERVLKALKEKLAPQKLLYVEQDKDIQHLLEGFEVIKEKKAASVYYYLLQVAA